MDPHTLSISIHNTADDAPDYQAQNPVPTPLNLTKAVIVRQGTRGGNPTVDFVLEDTQGNRYVTMITGKLLQSVTILYKT